MYQCLDSNDRPFLSVRLEKKTEREKRKLTT